MLVRTGDFVEVKDKIFPGILLDIKLRESDLEFIDADTSSKYAKVIECSIYFPDEPIDHYYDSTYCLKDIVKVISEEHYYNLTSLDEGVLRNLQHYWKKKCSDIYSWSEFIELYNSDPKEVMRWIPIRKVMAPGIILFADGSIWKCKKVKVRDHCYRKRHRKHHIYIPKIKLYGIN